MKASDLEIRDLFLYKGNIVEVVSIDGGTETAWIDGKKVSALRKIDDLQPILLTPEILEKSGIVYDYEETECVADYTYVNIKGYQFHDDDNGVLIDYCNGHINIINDFIGTIAMDINYVHELQHVLRLLKIGKEIKL